MVANVDILALGEPLIEMVRLSEGDQASSVFQSGVGGDVLNALVAASRQCASTGLISAVGADPFGDEIKAFCAREGVDTSATVTRKQDPTGVCFIYPDPSRRRFSYARRGSAASHYTASALPEEAIAAAQVLHVSAVSQAISSSMREAVFRAAEIARANETLVSFDLNLRLNLWPLDEARACIEAFLPMADIVLPSLDEAETLTGLTDPEAIQDTYARHGARYVALKMGEIGVLFQDAETRHTIAAPKVTAVDSTGAGDSFAGAFLAYLIETGDGVEAATRAVRVAAQTVTGLGATDPIPTRDQI